MQLPEAHNEQASQLKLATAKLALWAASYRRLLYFDADHPPVGWRTEAQRQLRASRLHQLWALAELKPGENRSTKVLALQDTPPPRRCFNSGLLLLHPDLAMHRLLMHWLHVPPATSDLARCNHAAKGTDQPLLNLVFPQWTDISGIWRFGSLWKCPPPSSDTDSFHFFWGTRPWEARVQCVGPRQVHGGRVCMPLAARAAARAENSSSCCTVRWTHNKRSPAHLSAARTRALKISACVATIAELHQLWLIHFNQLPAVTRHSCLERFKPLGT